MNVDPERERALASYIEELCNMPGEVAVFTVEHNVEDDGEGSFSKEALNQLQAELMLWVTSRVMRRWNATNEPPSWLTVEVNVTVA